MTPSGRSQKHRLRLLALGALGVVYGDIGTSPLYALKEGFHARHHGIVGESAVLGILSLILWSLVLIVSIKYIALVLRADHKGEGGILALVALLRDGEGIRKGRWTPALIATGIFGAALLYGDGMITPAISVLSAVEGLSYATPSLQPFVLPATVVILLLLFAFQRTGAGNLGRVFGPIMLVWFASLAAIGIWQITKAPEVLRAWNPAWAFAYLTQNGAGGFFVLGSVFLAVTGAEALYADLGHFGRAPISMAWHRVVLPALALNYLGQGALVLHTPSAVENPFFATVPGWAFYPMLILATAAAVIASQALISGAFSLTMQAIQLGYFPRLDIRHTSSHESGQIYIPQINWALMLACIALVLGFQSSGALAGAYGIAVATTMVVTTLLFTMIVRQVWKWPPAVALGIGALFLIVEAGYLGANLFKIPHGGWFALTVGVALFTLMRIWRRGRSILYEKIHPTLLPLETFLESVEQAPPRTVRGCAVFLTSNADTTPLALLHNLKHNKVLHETVIVLTVRTELRAYIEHQDERIQARTLGRGFYQVTAVYGYMDEPSIPELMDALRDQGIPIPETDITYFLSRERLVPGALRDLRVWERRIFSTLSKHSTSPADFFHLPPDRVVEIGVQIGC